MGCRCTGQAPNTQSTSKAMNFRLGTQRRPRGPARGLVPAASKCARAHDFLCSAGGRPQRRNVHPQIRRGCPRVWSKNKKEYTPPPWLVAQNTCSPVIGCESLQGSFDDAPTGFRFIRYDTATRHASHVEDVKVYWMGGLGRRRGASRQLQLCNSRKTTITSVRP
jgi:hypothetical protein